MTRSPGLEVGSVLAIFVIGFLIFMSLLSDVTGGLEMPAPPMSVTTAPWNQPSTGAQGTGGQDDYDERCNHIGYPFGTGVELLEGTVVSVAAPSRSRPASPPRW